jgi:hypothetical protein
MKKLSEKELSELTHLTKMHSELRNRVSELALANFRALSHLESIDHQLNEKRSALAKKYGEGASINMETGEVNVNS